MIIATSMIYTEFHKRISQRRGTSAAHRSHNSFMMLQKALAEWVFPQKRLHTGIALKAKIFSQTFQQNSLTLPVRLAKTKAAIQHAEPAGSLQHS